MKARPGFAAGVPVSVTAIIAALALFVFSAISRLPLSLWPSWPFDPATMSLDQIVLAYTLAPRAVVAILAGAALGVSGALLQAMLRNPIADPSTLGISSGAQLAIVIATLFFPSALDAGRTPVALGGAFAAAALVFLLGWRRGFEPVTMIIGGLLIGLTAGSLSAAFVLSQGEYLMSLVVWNGGALSQQGWGSAQALALQVGAGAAAGILLVRPLAILSLDDTSARSLGIGVAGTRLAVGAVAVWLAASVAAAVGLVSFIGLAAPSLVRLMGVRRLGSGIATSALAGGVLLWLSDGLVQLVAQSAGEAFPTGAVTALLGGPLLLWMLPRLRQTRTVVATGSQALFRQSRPWMVLSGLMVLLPAVSAVLLLTGRDADGWVVLSGRAFADLLPLRWPRLLAAAASGGLLALAGALLQRLTANPMASPEVMGITGGAGVGFAVSVTVLPVGGPFALLAGACAGALLVLVVILLFAMRRHVAPERLLLCGIAMSSLGMAVLSVLLAVGDMRSWLILAWLGGSAATADPVSALFLGGLCVAGLLAGLMATRWLAILPLGMAASQALGLPMRGSRFSLVLIAAVATGAASLLVGPLSFVGLMAPHMAAKAGFVRPVHHIAASVLIGCLLMVFADFGARTVSFPYELPLGLFASLVGAPYMVWLIAWGRA